MIRFITLLLICVLPQFAQRWDKVQGLGSRHEVRVETAQDKFSGALLDVNADMLRLRLTAGSEVSFPREDIQRVYVRTKSNRLRNALIGVGVGVAVGAVMYGTIGQLFRNEGAESSGFLTVPILVGTAAGGLMPTGGMKLVYDARKK